MKKKDFELKDFCLMRDLVMEKLQLSFGNPKLAPSIINSNSSQIVDSDPNQNIPSNLQNMMDEGWYGVRV